MSCAALNCSSRTTKGGVKDPELSFHTFPKDPDIKDKWISATGKRNWFPTNNSRICSVHFINEQFNSSTKRRTLVKSAVPTVDIWQFVTSERTNEESSVRLPDEGDDEITVFCPNCDTEVLHTAEGIQKDQTKIIVARVYHYFEQEYEELKNTYDGMDLTPLSKFRQRTALATGVSESTVCEILQEEEKRNAEAHVQLRVPRKARKRSRQTDSSNEEVGFESNDDEDDDEEQSSSDHATETLVVKEEPLETSNEEPENYTELSDVKDEPGVSGANEELADPIVADVKTEPQDEEANNSNETRALQPASKRYKGKARGRNEEASPGPSAPLGSSAPPGTSAPPGPSAPPTTRKRELLLLEDGEVKLKDIEIGEEGFS